VRKALGYLLIAASVVGGVYMVFVTFAQWLGSGTGAQLLRDGAILAALLVVFVAGYYLATALDVRR
jgi:ABC-type Na+ efflux pump permease subunit